MVHTVCTIVIFFCFFLSQLGLNKSLNGWNLNGCPCFFLVGFHPKIAILLLLDCCCCSNFHQSSKLPRTQRFRPWRSIDTSSKFATKPLSTTRCFGGFFGDKFETSILGVFFSLLLVLWRSVWIGNAVFLGVKWGFATEMSDYCLLLMTLSYCIYNYHSNRWYLCTCDPKPCKNEMLFWSERDQTKRLDSTYLSILFS